MRMLYVKNAAEEEASPAAEAAGHSVPCCAPKRTSAEEPGATPPAAPSAAPWPLLSCEAGGGTSAALSA